MTSRFAVNAFFFINGFIFANWASRIPRLQEVYGMDNSALGYILLAHSIGAFIAMPGTGWLIHRYGSDRITFLSGLFYAISFLMLSNSPSYWVLFLPFFMMGATSGVLDVAMNAQAVDIERLYHKPIMTFFHALFSIGMVFGGLSGSLFTKLGWELTPHFTMVALLSALTMFLVRKALLPETIQNAAKEDQPFLMLPRGPVIALGFIAFCCMIGEAAMSDWSTNYMKNIMLSPESSAAFGLTAFAAAMTTGRLIGDRARAKYGDKKMLIAGTILSIIGLFLVLLKLHFVTVLIGFAIVGLGLSNIVPIVYSLSGDLEGIPTGVGIAMATTIGYSGFMIGPPVIGFLADRWDLHKALFSILLLFVIMFFVVFRYQSIFRKKTTNQT